MSEWIIRAQNMDDISDGFFSIERKLVRCGDCKHYRESDPGHPFCDWCNRLICGTISKDFFCADGERRTE